MKMTLKEFENISETLRPKLHNIASKFLRVSDASIEPDDIVLEALVALWQFICREPNIKNIEALSVKIAKNICVAHYRKRQPQLLPLTGDDYAGGYSPSQGLDEVEAAALKRRLYGTLTSTQRLYLKLRDEESLSLDEIAALSGKPKASIKTTISAARRQLLKEIKALM
ncbi:MAG: RNA polymerase sigma factor [Bacteroidales bacterium]|nr:RNA polymerase sigma factor [Bacteroidales bacterium]